MHKQTSPQEDKLVKKLIEIGVTDADPQHKFYYQNKNGKREHTTVDIYIPSAKLIIEVDGPPHFKEVKQIISDIERDHYSDNGRFFTKRIPNIYIDNHLPEIANAIKKAVDEIISKKLYEKLDS